MLRLAFPIYSRTASLEEMRRLRGRIVRVHTVILYPLLTALIVVAPELVPLVFGSEWEPAVFPTQVLAVAGMGAVAAIGVEPLLLGAGKPRPMLYYNLVLLAGYGVVVAWASGYGLRTVVVAVAVYQVVLVAGQFFFLESRQVGIPLRETWTAVLPAVVAAGVSVAGAYLAARAIAETGTADVVVVVTGATCALGMYALALRVLFPAVWHEVRGLTSAFVGRRPS
jgi:O-antigen/teichoic acid export membrane protein